MTSPTTTPPACAVLVLLPVYNGVRFLAEQIESILNQSLAHVYILCRDDGSTDRSREVLDTYRQRHPQRVHVLADDKGNLGACGNFAELLAAALTFTPPDVPAGWPLYIALSDQDDLWHSDKLAICAQRLQALEAGDERTPALVHADLRLVTENGQEIAPSMARFQGLQVQLPGFAAQLLSNTVTGCTSLMNQALIRRALPIHPEAIMHDWWLSLVASAFGRRAYIDQAVIDYRQHQANTIGAKKKDEPVIYRSILHRIFDNRHAEIFRLNARQARAFRQRFGPELTFRQALAARLAGWLEGPPAPIQRFLYRVLRRL